MSLTPSTPSADVLPLEIEGLEFAWQAGQAPLLKIPSLQVRAGERVFVKGASGSGKSTLLGLIAGINRAGAGSVRVLGQALEHLGGSQRDALRADHMGVIFQQFNLLPYLSVVDNVLLACGFSARRRARFETHAAAVAEAHRLLSHLDIAPDLFDRRSDRLSVGQQQRVAAARALLGRPELLIADEPTSALDADRRRAFLELLFEECRLEGTALIFVSHDAGLEPMFDRSFSLDHGEKR